MFTYMTRWVPTPERRARPRPATSPEADVYRRLIDPPAKPNSSRGRQLLKGGVLGLTALGVAGWLWKTRESRQDRDGDGRARLPTPASDAASGE
jgi:hypothetical protein